MRIASLLVLASLGLAGGIVAACSSDSTPAATPTKDGGADAGGGGEGPFATPAVPCTDADTAIYGDPGTLTKDDASRGKILKCSKGTTLTQAQVQAELTRTGYKGTPVTSGANVIKVLYQTTRGDSGNSAGASSAIVYTPTVPRAATLPIVVGARGSRGQALRCALSKLDPSIAGLNDDLYRLAYSLVGLGYAVIVPDLAGYANFGAAGNPLSAYADSDDVARSTLDGSRALKQLFPSLDDKTVIVGHSQGGHSALSSLAESTSYGVQGSLVAVATYSPLWFTQRSWGAVANAAAAIALGVQTTGSGETPSATDILYVYTHAELLDGIGSGVKLFRPEYQTTVKNFVEQNCYGEDTPLQTVDYIYKMYNDDSAAAIGKAGAGTCGTDALCTTWQTRFDNDRPHLTGAAQTTPLLVLYGGADTTIPPDRASCGRDRLKSDGAKMTFCYEPTADHHTILDMRSSYVADWIASQAMGAAVPTACPQDETALTTPCNQTPPNN
jgi:alpha-beta hydrolase superfamily lysophospholipase